MQIVFHSRKAMNKKKYSKDQGDQSLAPAEFRRKPPEAVKHV